VRSVIPLALVLGGCNALLGITDPKIAAGDADTQHDAVFDGRVESGDHLEISLASFSLAQQQAVHLRARLVHMDGTSGDVTTLVTWATADFTIASAKPDGEVDGVTPGQVAITASLGDATPANVTATVTTEVCHVTINEVQAGGAVSASDEWVEIANPCTGSISIDGFKLAYRAANANGATDTNTMTALAGAIDAGAIQLFAGPDFGGVKDGGWAAGLMQANSGGVAIRDTANLIVDSVAYGTVIAGHPFIEHAAAPGLVNAKSIARFPFDGNDTDAGDADFHLVDTPTPRASNVK
jgi:Big-like domain-containing protein